MRVRLGLIAGLAGIIGLTSCGGGSDFSSRVNSLCSAYQAQAKAIPKPTSNAGVPAYADRALPPARAFIAKLQAVTAPSDKRAAYQEYLAGADHEVRLLEATSSAVRSGQAKRAAEFGRQLSAQVRIDNARASALGLNACATG